MVWNAHDVGQLPLLSEAIEKIKFSHMFKTCSTCLSNEMASSWLPDCGGCKHFEQGNYKRNYLSVLELKVLIAAKRYI
jgi:hypothetical protein